MKSFFSKEILTNPLILSAIGGVVLIGIGSIIYYVAATRLPVAVLATPTTGTIEEVVTGTGAVTPAQNPDLAFESGGRVARISVTVGSKVFQGELLASLDTSELQAQRAQAAANLSSQQANLSQMQAGPRQVDVQAKQTAVDQANTALSNFYASIPANITQAYDESFSGISASTDILFAQPNSPTPTLIFSTTNSQLATNVINDREQINGELSTWSIQANALSENSSTVDIGAALIVSLAHLQVLRLYSDTLLQALGGAVPSSSFPQASVAAAQTAVGALRDKINGLILTLQGEQQQISTDKLMISSAQDALNQTLAGLTPQAIEAQQAQVAAAQANVENFNAQIQNAIVVAPFSGTVSSVHVKEGDIVSPNTIAVSLNPESALQIDVYLTEVDVAKLQLGDSAEVTLDAYGNARVFHASVVSIDHSPTMQNGIPAYKTTLQFSDADPSITSGMTANVTIAAAQKQNVLIIPLSAIVQNGNQYFVLIPSQGSTAERQIQIGLESTSTVEVISGLSQNDQFLVNGK